MFSAIFFTILDKTILKNKHNKRKKIGNSTDRQASCMDTDIKKAQQKRDNEAAKVSRRQAIQWRDLENNHIKMRDKYREKVDSVPAFLIL